MANTDRLSRFSLLVLVYNVAVILWGAVVRASGSGAGCGSHWPLCNGEVMPRAPRLETVIELSHRLTSGLALVLVVALAAAAFRLRPQGDPTRKAAVAGVLLMLSEAAVGAGLVLFRLVADNQSMARAMFMGTHLLNTFFLLGALTLTAWLAGGGAPLRPTEKGRGWLAWSLLLGVLGLLLAGVSGAVAALGDTLWPARSLAEALRQDLSPTAHLLIRLRLLHPTIAVAAGLWALFLTMQPGRRTPWRLWTAVLVVLQWIAGAVNVALLAPVWMQVVHLLVADLLWIAFVLFAASALSPETALEADAGVVELVEVRGEG
jgi:heme A synthase